MHDWYARERARAWRYWIAEGFLYARIPTLHCPRRPVARHFRAASGLSEKGGLGSPTENYSNARASEDATCIAAPKR